LLAIDENPAKVSESRVFLSKHERISMLEPRQREIVRTLWEVGRLSRWELHEKTGLTPNNVGTVADALLRQGVVRECVPEPSGAGRPRVPLEIDPTRRHVIGLAIGPGGVEASRVGLRGQPIGASVAKTVEDPSKLIPAAAAIVRKMVSPEAMGIGLSITGFVDIAEHAVLLSSALPGKSHVSLGPVYQAAGELPVILENDMHALAARWLLTHRAASQDVLLVLVEDGRLGAAMLIDGRPNRGCATGANELGHNRFIVDTEKCFCGHVGCLERIISTPFLHRHNGDGATDDTLVDRLASYEAPGNDKAVDLIAQYFSCGLANAINFVRPHRLVLVSPLTRNPAFTDELFRQTRAQVLTGLADRVKIGLWDEPTAGSAETAGWLALAQLFFGGWGAEALPVPGSRREKVRF
jgi:predicted NBD/HSP70 family sugar kinase